MRTITTALLCFALTPVGAQAQAQEKGILWEQSSQAEIPGMSVNVPAITMQHCMKEDWASAPEAAGDPSQHCKNTDFKREGNKLTWAVVCENPPMTGAGELTFDGADSYAGAVQFKTADKTIRVNLTGKKIGTCDNPQ
jgi:hypothetical protein